MNFSVRKELPFLALLFLALALRLYHLDLPFLEPYNSLSRQSISATVARNFYENGFRFFYPEINENGHGPYFFQGEMPVVTFLMAVAYQLAGGAHEWAARLVSVMFSAGSIITLYLFARRLCGYTAALAAAAVFSFSPLGLALSRSVQPEAAMIFFSLAALYTFRLYSDSEKAHYGLLCAVFLFLAVAVKFYNAYLLLPIYFMSWQKWGRRAFTGFKVHGIALFALTAMAWYVYAWQMERTQALAYVVYQMTKTRGPAGKSYFGLLFSPHYLFFVGKVFVLHLLAPIGFALAAAGWTRLRKNENADAVVMVWILSSLALMLFLWRTAIDHSYYQLPLLPVFSVLAGKGYAWFLDLFRARRPLISALSGPLIAAHAAVLFHLYPGIFQVPPAMAAVKEAGEAVQRLADKDDLVVATYETGPIQLYYTDRRGWALDITGGDAAKLIAELERYKTEGARYYVISSLHNLPLAPGFGEYLDAHFPAVQKSGYFRVYSLK